MAVTQEQLIISQHPFRFWFLTNISLGIPNLNAQYGSIPDI